MLFRSQISALAQERRVQIIEELEPASTVAVEDHIRILFGNLLSNAILYSHHGGRVRVSCHLVPGNGPEVVIEDHGIGIAQEKLSRIFEEYYHTEDAVRHNRWSTGLGLAIVRQVADSHGIRVRVESRPGQGTRFVLRFSPVGQSPEPEDL